MASYLINLIEKISGDEYLVRCLKMCDIVEFNEIISIDDKTLDRMEIYLQKKCSRMPLCERSHVLGDKFANNPEIFRFSPASRQRILNLVEKLDKIFNNKSFPVSLSSVSDMCNRLALGYSAPVTTVPMNAVKMLMYPGNMLVENANESCRLLQSKPNDLEIITKSVPPESAPTQRFTNIFQKMDAIRNGDVDLSIKSTTSADRAPFQTVFPSNKENIDMATESELIEKVPKTNKRKVANGVVRSDSKSKRVSTSPSEKEKSTDLVQSSPPVTKKRKYVRKTVGESELRGRSQRLMNQKTSNPDELSKEPTQIDTATPDSPSSPDKPNKHETSPENIETQVPLANVTPAVETVVDSPKPPVESAAVIPAKKPSAKLADFLFRPSEPPARKSVAIKNKTRLMKPVPSSLTATVTSNDRISPPAPPTRDSVVRQSDPSTKTSSRNKIKMQLSRSVSPNDVDTESSLADVSLRVSVPPSTKSDLSLLPADLAVSDMTNRKRNPKLMPPILMTQSSSPPASLPLSSQSRGVPSPPPMEPTKKVHSLKLSDFPFQRLDCPPVKNPKKSRLSSNGPLSKTSVPRSSQAPPAKLSYPVADAIGKFVIKTTNLSQIKIPKLSSYLRPLQDLDEPNQPVPSVPPTVKVHHLSTPTNAVAKNYGPGRTLSTIKLSSIHRANSPIGNVSSSLLSLQSSYDQSKLAPCRFQPFTVSVPVPLASFPSVAAVSPPATAAAPPSPPRSENVPPTLLETDTSSNDAMDPARSMSPPVIKSIVTSTTTAVDPFQLNKSFDLSSIKPVWTNSPNLIFSNRFINSNKHRNVVSSPLTIVSMPDTSTTTFVKVEPSVDLNEQQSQSPASPVVTAQQPLASLPAVVTKSEPTHNI